MFFQRLEDLRVDHDKSQIEIAAYLNMNRNVSVSYTHLTLPTTPYV